MLDTLNLCCIVSAEICSSGKLDLYFAVLELKEKIVAK